MLAPDFSVQPCWPQCWRWCRAPPASHQRQQAAVVAAPAPDALAVAVESSHDGVKVLRKDLELGTCLETGECPSLAGVTKAAATPPQSSAVLMAVADDDDFEGDMAGSESVPGWVDNYTRKGFHFSSLLPPLQWLPPYVRSILGRAHEDDVKGAGNLPYSLAGDIVAGTTVGVMLVPQCLAFAMLAGLPVQVGLYSSFAPLVAYACFGTIRQVQPGPTALVSLLTGQALDSVGLQDAAARMAAASLLALAVGVISVLLGMVRFGFIVDFMSHSVMIAFCTAAGITIGTSQLKHLFGIEMPRQKYWWQTVHYLFTHLGEADLATCLLGCTLLAVLLTLKYWKAAGSAEKRRGHPIWRCFPREPKARSFRALKLVADLSSLLSVLIGWVWGLVYRQVGVDTVRLVGSIDSSGFVFRAPDVASIDDLGGNTILITGAVIAVVGFLETVAVGGKFAAKARYEYVPNQELIALGAANIAGAFMSGYPGTGSFTRTAVNAMFGATSLVACVLSAVIVLLAVFVLLPVISLLPLASLAPIIIQGAIGVIDFHGFRVARRASAAEFGVMLATLVFSLALSVKEGLLVGFVLSVLSTMNDLAHPNMAVCGRLPDDTFRDIRNFPQAKPLPHAVVVRMDARLSFANTRRMKEFCLRAIQVREAQGDRIDFVVVDGKSINHVDLTGCEMLEALAEALKGRGQRLVIANLKGPVSKCLASASVPEVLQRHDGHLCIDMDQAIAIINDQDRGGQAASQQLQALVRRVDTAKLQLQQSHPSLLVCSSPSPCAVNKP